MRQLFPASTSTSVRLEDLAPSYLAEQVPASPQLPFVRVNMVASIDGVTRGASGTSADLTSPSDLGMLSMLRACSDAVLVGASTVRAVAYRAPKAHARWEQLRAAAGLTDRPRLVIVTREGIPVDNISFSDPSHRPIVVAPLACETRDAMSDVADVWTVGDDAADLAALLMQMKLQGFNRVVCEGGPGLLSGLSAVDLIDELCITTAPIWLGGGDLHLTRNSVSELTLRCEMKRLLVSDDSYLFAQWQRTSH